MRVKTMIEGKKSCTKVSRSVLRLDFVHMGVGEGKDMKRTG